MKLSNSKKILILSVATFIFILVLDVIFTNLLLNKIASINDKIKQLEISSQERERELNLKDLIADTEIDRKKLEAYFIGAGNAKTVEFTKHLEGLALATGVTEKKTLNYEAISGLPSSGVVSAIRYKVDASGKWQNIYYFLQEIENLPTVMLLNGVSLSFNTPQTASPETKAVSSRWSASLDFSVAQLKN